ncbi:hypothetical protein EVAR_92045_1 [Eumeta japonica]|uniref:Uncharacterized protein n=1 Tax=Eumeta variegata TaxID=151549 RepID=A0A4C1SY56_EUMVA|nr:hypothetical protein EVAR_92045_1 [Eumeta japonica]
MGKRALFDLTKKRARCRVDRQLVLTHFRQYLHSDLPSRAASDDVIYVEANSNAFRCTPKSSRYLAGSVCTTSARRSPHNSFVQRSSSLLMMSPAYCHLELLLYRRIRSNILSRNYTGYTQSAASPSETSETGPRRVVVPSLSWALISARSHFPGAVSRS